MNHRRSQAHDWHLRDTQPSKNVTSCFSNLAGGASYPAQTKATLTRAYQLSGLGRKDSSVLSSEQPSVLFPSCETIQQFCYLRRNSIGSQDQRRIEMHVALGDPAGRVTEKAGDGQLGKAKISGHASESMAKNVR